MRATVLCILVFAGATCALQIPSIPSPQSALDAGSSVLGNIPGIKRGDDSSSSSSSSEEDQKPSNIATELAERLVDDMANAAGGIGSIALLPLNIGTTVFDSITKEIRNFLGDVLQQDGPTVPELAVDLARSVIHDVQKMAGNIGSIVLEPVRFKTQLIKTIARGVDKFLKNVQNQISGDSSAQHYPRPNDRPHQGQQPANSHHRPSSTHRPRPSSQRPRPTSSGRPSSERPRPTPSGRPTSERPRPTPSGRPSSERPRPTPSEGPRPTPSGRPSSERPTSSVPATSVRTVSKVDSVHVRVARDIGLSISGSIGFEAVIDDSKLRNLTKALASVDFSKIVKPIPKIPDLTPLSELPPELASITKRARNLVIHTIAAGASTIEEAIQIALSAAIRNAKPAEAIVNLVNIILQVYFFVAQSALGIPSVYTALLKEAAIVGGSIVSSLLAVMSESDAAGVRALLN